ncbi:MAG TPA: hypothetical protein PKW49_03380 [Paludibacteraceae bacterium]|nr:hypothetical protein [Paludibacteraceae bacterium]HQK35611.1 hypothetical protein [Spirochaetales bacterium]
MEKTIVTCVKDRLDISSIVEFIADGFANNAATLIDDAIFSHLRTCPNLV